MRRFVRFDSAPIWWGVAAFLLIATARLAQVASVAGEAPYYDDWDALSQIVVALRDGSLGPAHLLVPHNQHAMAPTKALLLLQLAMSQWQFDNRIVCAMLQGIFALAAAAMLVPAVSNLPHARAAFATAALGLCVIPYAWETLPTAYGSGYLFLIAFSVALVCAVATASGSWRSLVGVGVLAAAAASTLASGVVAALVALLLLGLRVRATTLPASRALAISVPLLMAIGLGAWVAMRAGSGASTWALGPRQVLEGGVLLAIWLPTGMLLAQLWRRRIAPAADLAWSGLALWGLAQFALVIALRPEFRLWFPVSRYMDLFGVAALANLGCALRVVAQLPPAWQVRARRGAVVACRAFALLVLLGSPFAWRYFDARVDVARAGDAVLVEHARHATPIVLAGAPGGVIPQALLYPDLQRLQALLADPGLRWMLGDRLGSRPAAAPAVVFERRVSAWLQAHGAWAWSAGLLLAALAAWRAWQRGPRLPDAPRTS